MEEGVWKPKAPGKLVPDIGSGYLWMAIRPNGETGDAGGFQST